MSKSDALDFRDRNAVFTRLSQQKFDLLVIGGGITGAGIARDAALRGLNVAVVEASDFASGTSSRSSKLVHGGLRYLSQGDVGLVREAATERLHLRNIAPHLAQPIPFVIPARSKTAMATLRTGMWTFEKLGKVPADEKHFIWSKQELADNEPAVNSDLFNGAVVYQECMTEDARLTLANLRSAKHAGAEMINYAPVTDIIVEHGKATGLIVRDALEDAEYRLTASLLVNAAGPWVDAIRRLESHSTATRLQLTKGIHVVVPRVKLPLNNTVIINATDKRGLFAVPKNQSIYIGTTDTFYPNSDYWPTVTAEDVQYLIDNFNTKLKSEPLSATDITAVWSGIRPLVSQEGKSPSEISRKDELWTGPAGILSIAGGKLTAYRKMAERIVDDVQTRLGLTVSTCVTHQQPLVGGERAVADIMNDPLMRDLQHHATNRLTRLYGTEALAIVSQGADIRAETRHAVLAEGAVTLEDYWVRRSSRAWFDNDAGLSALPIAAGEMAELLGWNDKHKDNQITMCEQIHQSSLSWRRPEQTINE